MNSTTEILKIKKGEAQKKDVGAVQTGTLFGNWQQHKLNQSLGSETHLRMRGTTLNGRANRQHLL